MTRIRRTKEEMLIRLKEKLRFLEKRIHEFEDDRDVEIFGEIMTYLRVLLYRPKGRGEPLLLKLAEEYNIEIRMTSKNPAHNNMLLDDYILTDAHMTTVQGVKYNFSHMDMVMLWSCQNGLAHEDWDIEESLIALIKSTKINFWVNGFQVTQMQLLGFARSILNTGKDFISFIEKN